jgi:Domain of unknown function (DUF6268)
MSLPAFAQEDAKAQSTQAAEVSNLGSQVAVQQPAQQPASETATDGGLKPDDDAMSATWSLFANHTFSSDFSDAPGDVSMTALGTEVSVDIPHGPSSSFGINIHADRLLYNFSDATGFVSGISEPWDDIWGTGVSLSFRDQIDARWGYFVGLGVESWGQDGADFSDTLTYGGVLGVTYAQSRGLVLGMGVSIFTRLEDDARIFPLPIFRWQINDDLTLRTDGQALGAGLVLGYGLSDSWTLEAGVGFQTYEFRLAESAAAPGGVGSDTRIGLGLGAVYKPHDQILLSAAILVNLQNEYELSDRTGNSISKQDAETSFGLRFGATFQF